MHLAQALELLEHVHTRLTELSLELSLSLSEPSGRLAALTESSEASPHSLGLPALVVLGAAVGHLRHDDGTPAAL